MSARTIITTKPPENMIFTDFIIIFLKNNCTCRNPLSSVNVASVGNHCTSLSACQSKSLGLGMRRQRPRPTVSIRCWQTYRPCGGDFWGRGPGPQTCNPRGTCGPGLQCPSAYIPLSLPCQTHPGQWRCSQKSASPRSTLPSSLSSTSSR